MIEQKKLRKWLFIFMAFYTLLMLYFLFIGFGRTSTIGSGQLRYNLVPDGIHLYFPSGRILKQWIFELGNFLLFVPFGMFIPLLVRARFVRFISIFVVAITLIEIIQMVTRLGAFDIDDILVNTLGAAVGYAAQRVVKRHRTRWTGLVRIIVIAIVFSVVTITAVGSIHYYFDNVKGKTVALHELPASGEEMIWDEELTNITVGQTLIEPKMNLIRLKNNRAADLSYRLDTKYAELSGHLAMQNSMSDSFSGSISIVFYADGVEIYSLGYVITDSEESYLTDSFSVPLHGVEELTIKVMSDVVSDVIIWDIILTELNAGEKFINSIKSIF